MNTYRRSPLVFVRGKGCYLYDQHGRKYLDFLGGIAVNALGHAHPRLVRVMRREAARDGPRLEPLSPPVSGTAGAKACRMVGHGPRVFLQQRHRGH